MVRYIGNNIYGEIMNLKEFVYSNIKDIEELNQVENFGNLLINTVDSSLGDISLPCFTYSKVLRKSPMDIANEFANLCACDSFEAVKAVNGYVNFYVNKSAFTKAVLDSALSQGVDYGRQDIGQGKVVCIDYSSVNLAKYMHIGHLGTTIIGNVIKNIYKFFGYKVFGLNYLGNYGTPFGKMITGYLHYGSKEDVDARGVDAIQEYYVKFNQEVESHPELMDEARLWFKKIEDQDPEALKIYDWFIDISIDEAKRIYKLLNITFDDWTGEAYYNDKMGPIIAELENSGLLQTSEGAKVVDLEKYNLGTCLILKSDGSSLYATRDLAAVQDRYNKYNFDKCLYVTDVAQKLHFAQWFKVCELLNKPYANNLKHIYYGRYSLPTGKIGSRYGKQALISDMINISFEKAKEIMLTRGTKVEDIDKIAMDIAIGAICFGTIKNEKTKDSVFDLEKALSFEGETSPYLQYTFARCNSIISKCNILDSDIRLGDNIDDILDGNTFELIKHINSYSDTLVSALNNEEPSHISKYLLSLCSLFNRFYNENRVIENDVPNINRLCLVKVVKDILYSGLSILGITPIEKM